MSDFQQTITSLNLLHTSLYRMELFMNAKAVKNAKTDVISLISRLEKAERERDELRERLSLVREQRDTELNKNIQLEAEITRRDSAAGEADYWQFKSVNGDWIGISESAMRQAASEGVEVRPLYTAAPPAVLPPEMKPEPKKYDVIDHGFIAGYNKCRADSLALGAQQQMVVELDNVFSIDVAGVPVRVVLLKDVSTSLDAAGVKWEVKK
ncbi:hypothetical protein JNO12_12615 [Erwinia aphidicola]|nr:hypothetical protein [Erwinia aphidicola]